jgi:hypothetical protein
VPEYAVCPQRHQGVDIPGGRDPDRVDPREIAGVAPLLLLVVDEDPRDLQRRVAGEQADDLRANPAGVTDDACNYGAAISSLRPA